MTMYPRHRPNHLPTYDYAQPGSYFVTLCTTGRRSILGTITDGIVTLSLFGVIVRDALAGLADHYPGVSVDSSIVMPNHVHAVIVLGEENALTLHEIIRRFKSFTVGEYRRKIDRTYRVSQGHVWQEGYYDVVVRNERQLDALRLYMANNPKQWELDRENPEGKGKRG